MDRVRSASVRSCGASPPERKRINEGNTLMVNFLSACEALSTRGGVHLLEHPDDPGIEPHPSIWITPELLAFEELTGSARCRFDQCPFGAPTKKATCVSTNIADFPEEGPRCSCRTAHAPSRGRTIDGKYRSQRLAQYPGGMCDWIAQKLVATFVRWHRTGEGPTGWRLGATPTRRYQLVFAGSQPAGPWSGISQ